MYANAARNITRCACIAPVLVLAMQAGCARADSDLPVVDRLPGLVQEVRFQGAGVRAYPHVMAVARSGMVIWVAGNSAEGAAGGLWLKKLNPQGSVIQDVDIALEDDAEIASQSSIRFKAAVALPDGGVALAVNHAPQQPMVVGVDQQGTVTYRTKMFGGKPGEISALRLTDDGRVMALGHRSEDGFHQWATIVEIDAGGTVTREETLRGAAHTSFKGGVDAQGGGLILVGQWFSPDSDAAKVWMVRTDRNYEVLEERSFSGILDAAAAGRDGRFALCVSADPSTSDGQVVSISEFDEAMNLLWQTKIFRSSTRGFPFSCRLAGVPEDGYVVAGQAIDPAPSVTVARLNNSGGVVWKFVEPPSSTSYTWHYKLADFTARGDSFFALTELLLPPEGGGSASLAGLLHFKVPLPDPGQQSRRR